MRARSRRSAASWNRSTLRRLWKPSSARPAEHCRSCSTTRTRPVSLIPLRTPVALTSPSDHGPGAGCRVPGAGCRGGCRVPCRVTERPGVAAISWRSSRSFARIPPAKAEPQRHAAASAAPAVRGVGRGADRALSGHNVGPDDRRRVAGRRIIRVVGGAAGRMLLPVPAGCTAAAAAVMVRLWGSRSQRSAPCMASRPC